MVFRVDVYKASGRTIAQVFSLILLSLSFVLPSLLMATGERASNCTAVFIEDEAWSSTYPSCSVTVTITNCDAPPSVEFQGSPCYPNEGTIVVGEIIVFDDNGPTTRYQVKAVDGSGQVIFIEDL